MLGQEESQEGFLEEETLELHGEKHAPAAEVRKEHSRERQQHAWRSEEVVTVWWALGGLFWSDWSWEGRVEEVGERSDQPHSSGADRSPR